jgi:hypothetical protein
MSRIYKPEDIGITPEQFEELFNMLDEEDDI